MPVPFVKYCGTMAKNKPQKSFAAQGREKQLAEALQLAKGIHEDGQSKEQTRAIARGIAKGIALYKRQQKARAREQAKAQRKRDAAARRTAAAAEPTAGSEKRPARLGVVFAIAGWLVLAVAAVALAADLVSDSRLRSQLAAGNGSLANNVADLFPDVSPGGRVHRGWLLDTFAQCEDGRLRYELAGMSWRGRVAFTTPGELQVLASGCTADRQP